MTKVKYSDLASSNHETTIRIGSAETTILFGDYGSCYGDYTDTISINSTSNSVSYVSTSNLTSSYFNTIKSIINGVVLAGKKFTSDTSAGYIKFTSHGKTIIINVTIVAEAIEKNIEFNDSVNNYEIYVEDSSNCSLKLYYIYYEGKDSSGNWKKVTPSSNVLTNISLNFDGGSVTYTEDNYSSQYIVWNIPQQYIQGNLLPTTATATISVTDDTGAITTDTQTITFKNRYFWYTLLPGQDTTWSESSGFNITLSKNDEYEYGVAGFVAIMHTTRSLENINVTYTIKNITNITLNKSWGLSNLRFDDTDDNTIVLYTDQSLYNDLSSADTGTYTISGEIVSSLDGSSFPVTVNYKVEKQKTTVNCTISLSCGLKYTNKYCSDRLPTSTDADISIQCDNLTQLYWSYNYAAMPNGLNTTIDLGNIELDDVYSGILPSGVVEVTLPFTFITSTPSFTISFGGDASGSKTFYGARDNCVDYGDNPISGYHYTFDAGLSASGYFNSTTTTSIKININIG